MVARTKQSSFLADKNRSKFSDFLQPPKPKKKRKTCYLKKFREQGVRPRLYSRENRSGYQGNGARRMDLTKNRSFYKRGSKTNLTQWQRTLKGSQRKRENGSKKSEFFYLFCDKFRHRNKPANLLEKIKRKIKTSRSSVKKPKPAEDASKSSSESNRMENIVIRVTCPSVSNKSSINSALSQKENQKNKNGSKSAKEK